MKLNMYYSKLTSLNRVAKAELYGEFSTHVSGVSATLPSVIRNIKQ